MSPGDNQVIPTLDVTEDADWKTKREQFVRNVRLAKSSSNDVQSSRVRGGMAAAKAVDLVECPHCDRRFNEEAAERHVPICKESHDRARIRNTGSRSNTKKQTEKDAALRRRMSFDPRQVAAQARAGNEDSSDGRSKSMPSINAPMEVAEKKPRSKSSGKSIHCGECGSQYATERARFCVECGCKRC